MNTQEIQEALLSIGWPIATDGVSGPKTKEAILDFQAGFAFEALDQDGIAGPLTQAALTHCLDKDGRCSEFFQFVEFASKGNGWIKVNRNLAYALDQYRRLVDAPVGVVSGYRDPAHNQAAGGVSNSQHLYGTACDIPQVATWQEVRGLNLFSGIGYVAATGLVAHVDVRHAGPNTTTGGTPDAPTFWPY